MLATDLQIALDPVQIANITFGILPDDWQSKALRYHGKLLILNCARQSGKSLTASIKALHMAIYKPESLVLMLSPSLRQSSESFRVVSNLNKKDRLKKCLGKDKRNYNNMIPYACDKLLK